MNHLGTAVITVHYHLVPSQHVPKCAQAQADGKQLKPHDLPVFPAPEPLQTPFRWIRMGPIAHGTNEQDDTQMCGIASRVTKQVCARSLLITPWVQFGSAHVQDFAPPLKRGAKLYIHMTISR